MPGMSSLQQISKTPRAAGRSLLRLLAVAAAVACAGCEAPINLEHRVSVDVKARPKDLRACVVEAIKGIDGIPGVNPPPGGVESGLVEFRTTLPEVSGEVERRGDDSVQVTIAVMQHVEPDDFWKFAQPRVQAIGDAIAARCGAL